MEQMSITAPIFVLIELLRPFGFLLGLILLIELALMAIAISRRPWQGRRALKMAAGAGIVGGALAALLVLPLSGTGPSGLQSALDYLAYIAIILGVGAVAFSASLPALLLWRGSTPRPSMQP